MIFVYICVSYWIAIAQVAFSQDIFVITACDGSGAKLPQNLVGPWKPQLSPRLWDVIDDQEAVNLVIEGMRHAAVFSFFHSGQPQVVRLGNASFCHLKETLGMFWDAPPSSNTHLFHFPTELHAKTELQDVRIRTSSKLWKSSNSHHQNCFILLVGDA